MAEAEAEAATVSGKSKKSPYAIISAPDDFYECAVCLQACIHPAQLPCGHVFCYLCVKGFANQNKKCAMCRQEIPRDFIDQPQLLDLDSLPQLSGTFEGGYQWFYEGRNGWWQYDERTSKELENSYKNGGNNIELLIAGFLYIVDFENMIQLRRNDPSRRRQIKRDVASIPRKGIAGIRVNPPSSSAEPELSTPEEDVTTPTETLTDPIIPVISNDAWSYGTRNHLGRNALQTTIDLMNNFSLDCDGTADMESE